MSPPSVPSADPGSPPLRIACPACATELLVPQTRRSESGPCPKCGAWIDSALLLSDAARGLAQAPSAGFGKGKAAMRTGARGRVRPDGFMDHDYAEKRELYSTLRVLAVFLGVGAFILFVIIYGRQWMAG